MAVKLNEELEDGDAWAVNGLLMYPEKQSKINQHNRNFIPLLSLSKELFYIS